MNCCYTTCHLQFDEFTQFITTYLSHMEWWCMLYRDAHNCIFITQWWAFKHMHLLLLASFLCMTRSSAELQVQKPISSCA